jgi:hypothetical protein
MPTIPISTGELLDRMSILEIKMQRLPLRKVDECQYEYNQIACDIFHPDHKYYYDLLLRVNNKIWDLQDRLHHGLGDPIIDYPTILDLNDQRFKLKQKINCLVHSDLREQKGYDQRKCIVYGHLGMGDMYWMNGAVRFFSTVYDEVIVVTKTNNVSNTALMYQDDPTIKVWPVPFDVKIEDITSHLSEHVMIACGLASGVGAENYPDSFYVDMGLDPSIREIYFHHANSPESEILASQIEEPHILIHESKSNASIDLSHKFNPDKQLVLNIGRNIYPEEHRYHKLAELFVNKPLHCYIDTIERAEELHLIESSLACLAIHLNLSNVKTKKIYEASSNFVNLGVFEEGFV